MRPSLRFTLLCVILVFAFTAAFAQQAGDDAVARAAIASGQPDMGSRGVVDVQHVAVSSIGSIVLDADTGKVVGGSALPPSTAKPSPAPPPWPAMMISLISTTPGRTSPPSTRSIRSPHLAAHLLPKPVLTLPARPPKAAISGSRCWEMTQNLVVQPYSRA